MLKSLQSSVAALVVVEEEVAVAFVEGARGRAKKSKLGAAVVGAVFAAGRDENQSAGAAAVGAGAAKPGALPAGGGAKKPPWPEESGAAKLNCKPPVVRGSRFAGWREGSALMLT